MTINQIPTPELDKRAEARKHGSQEIGEFIEWLGSKGYQIGRYRDDLTDSRVCGGYTRRGTPTRLFDTDNCAKGEVSRVPFEHDGQTYRPGDQCPRCQGTGYLEVEVDEQFVPESKTVEQWLADYFEIDLAKVDREQKALLDALREMNNA